jgi:hypothetical protein
MFCDGLRMLDLFENLNAGVGKGHHLMVATKSITWLGPHAPSLLEAVITPQSVEGAGRTSLLLWTGSRHPQDLPA